MNKTVKIPRGTARKTRRAVGDLNPVNKVASLLEAPEGRFAKRIGKVEAAKLLA